MSSLTRAIQRARNGLGSKLGVHNPSAPKKSKVIAGRRRGKRGKNWMKHRKAAANG